MNDKDEWNDYTYEPDENKKGERKFWGMIVSTWHQGNSNKEQSERNLIICQC